MKRKYAKCLIVIVVVSLMGIFIYQNINKENKPLPEVKLKEIVNKNKSFAIMIQEKSETDKYQEYSSNKWPGDDYKFKEAKCIDNNGNEIKEAVTYEEGKITLTTNKTVYCTVYFDKSIIGKLRENEELANKDNLSKDLQGGMYRYQGTDDVHNWICFGTEENCGTNEDNIDKYMYRIIGVTKEGQLYLLKETFLKEGNINNFAWNLKTTISECLGEACEWPNVSLYKRINGISNGETTGNNSYPDYKGDTNIFLGTSEHTSPYEYLTEGNEWFNLIIYHDWIYGDTNISSWSNSNAYNGDYMYAIETGNTSTKRTWPDEEQGQTTCSDDSPCAEKEYTWTKSVSAKIGLMYMHDVDYAYKDGNSRNYVNVANSWIHFQKDGYNLSPSYEWLISRFGVVDSSNTSVKVMDVGYNGTLTNGTLSGSAGTRPTFYLTPNITLTGAGTKENPYIIHSI